MNKMKYSLIKVIFILAILLLIILSAFSFVRTRNLIKSSDWVNHSTIVQLNLTNTLSSVLIMETAQRGYLITKDSVFLTPYLLESEDLRNTFKKMDSLVYDNKSQTQHMAELKKMVFKRVGYLENILKESDSIAISKEKFMRGKVLMDEIEQQIKMMTAEEDKLLQQRIENLDKEIVFSPWISMLLFLFATFFILMAYFKIINDLREAERLKNEIEASNEMLGLKNEELSKNEERFLKIFDFSPVPMTLAEIGTNIITYANENFYKTFGYNKEEIIGHTSEELNLMTKEENERLISIMLIYLEDNRPLEELQKLSPEETAQLLLKLRLKMFQNGYEVQYQRKNKELFYALVFFEIVDLGDKKFTIASYQDITERKTAAAQLEKQNEDLLKMNKELESFNYISSHDLQEPLRKIQIFSSRIMETEKEKLSAQGQEYFTKIHDSAQRMQTLIRDLLAYSRISGDEQHFIKTSLEKIVEQVIADLKDDIEEDKAVVEIGNLDTLSIIPFQFHQMLTNLVCNSLKFSREGVTPEISIKSYIEKGSKLPHESLKADAMYCHIIVQDNGIGFEQEYAHRIFDVFRQLNSKGKYEGSGIGLSIVKKIVDNHNGYITASGELHVGARFDIYIPV